MKITGEQIFATCIGLSVILIVAGMTIHGIKKQTMDIVMAEKGYTLQPVQCTVYETAWVKEGTVIDLSPIKGASER